MLSRVPSFLTVFVLVSLVASVIFLFPCTLFLTQTPPRYLSLIITYMKSSHPPLDNIFHHNHSLSESTRTSSQPFLQVLLHLHPGYFSLTTTFRYSPPPPPRVFLLRKPLSGTLHHPGHFSLTTTYRQSPPPPWIFLPHNHPQVFTTTTTGTSPSQPPTRTLHHYHHPRQFFTTTLRYSLPPAVAAAAAAGTTCLPGINLTATAPRWNFKAFPPFLFPLPPPLPQPREDLDFT